MGKDDTKSTDVKSPPSELDSLKAKNGELTKVLTDVSRALEDTGFNLQFLSRQIKAHLSSGG